MEGLAAGVGALSDRSAGSAAPPKIRVLPRRAQNAVLLGDVVRPERLELPTLCSEGRCSIQLSYGRSKRYILRQSGL